jgi:hypothetical protein
MLEHFRWQLNKNVIVTEEHLAQMESKYYFNHEPVEVGDKILYALLQGREIRIDEAMGEIPLTLIALKPEHVDDFTTHPRWPDTTSDGRLPVVKLK